MAGKNTATFGLYADRIQVEDGIKALVTAGFRQEDISVLFPANEGTKDFAHEKNTKAPEGAATGVGAGGAIGGTLGLLVGIGALTIPGQLQWSKRQIQSVYADWAGRTQRARPALSRSICFHALDQLRDLAGSRANSQQGPHHQVDGHRPIRRFHLGDTRLAGTQLLRQRGLRNSALFPQLSDASGQCKFQFNELCFLGVWLEEVSRVLNSPPIPLQSCLLEGIHFRFLPSLEATLM